MLNLGRFMGEEPRLNLLREDQLPPHLREIAIISGYRPPESSLRQCLLSIFVATNETLNFWTHFIPTIYFLWKLVSLWETHDFVTDTYLWPFAAYMVTSCWYPLVSALAHTFYSMSNLARHYWFFLDYGGLSFYSFGSALIYRAYAFPESFLGTSYADLFLYVCTVNTVISTISACCSRFMDNLLWTKVFRLGAFFMPWMWDSVPLLYRIIFFEDIDTATHEHYARQFVFSLLIGFLYSSHLPERLAPGKFDIFGNSHQLVHICAILATHEQMKGALLDMSSRRQSLYTGGHVIASFWSLQVLASLFVINAIVIAGFTWYAWMFDSESQTSDSYSEVLNSCGIFTRIKQATKENCTELQNGSCNAKEKVS